MLAVTSVLAVTTIPDVLFSHIWTTIAVCYFSTLGRPGCQSNIRASSNNHTLVTQWEEALQVQAQWPTITEKLEQQPTATWSYWLHCTLLYQFDLKPSNETKCRSKLSADRAPLLRAANSRRAWTSDEGWCCESSAFSVVIIPWLYSNLASPDDKLIAHSVLLQVRVVRQPAPCQQPPRACHACNNWQGIQEVVAELSVHLCRDLSPTITIALQSTLWQHVHSHSINTNNQVWID